MRLFYVAAGQDGKRVKGFVEANDTAKAAVYLRDRGLIPIEIQTRITHRTTSVSHFMRRVTGKDIIFFTRQIASMLTSGLTLSQSLSILKNQTQKESVITLIDGIFGGIEEGKSFSDAVAQYPTVFSPVYISIVKAGETSGLLDKVMLRLAETLEKRDKLKSQIRGALLYPVIVLTLMLVVVAIMMLFVVPQLSTVYTSLNVELPLPTQIVVASSNFFVQYLPFILIACIGGGFYFNKWRKTEKGKTITDNWFIHAPLFGKLVKESAMVEFSRTFGLMIGTGALIIDSLQKSAEVLGNAVYKRAILQVAENVERGVSIGDAMSVNPLFPSILVEMVKIGEETGKLDQSLLRVSEYYEREVEQTVKSLTTAMEPLILVLLAVGVGFLIIAIITPIYSLLSAF